MSEVTLYREIRGVLDNMDPHGVVASGTKVTRESRQRPPLGGDCMLLGLHSRHTGTMRVLDSKKSVQA